MPSVNNLPDKVAISFGTKVVVRFEMNGKRPVHPKIIMAGKRTSGMLWLDFHEEKGKRVLRLTHNFRRTLNVRGCARLHGWDTYFETDLLPIPVRTINPELWSEPIDEMVLFAFSLSGEEQAPAKEDADVDVACTFEKNSGVTSAPYRVVVNKTAR